MKNTCCDFIIKYAKKNIAMVWLYGTHTTLASRDVEMTLSSFLGNAGGLVGLFMGFSLISLIKGFYHFIKVLIKSAVLAKSLQHYLFQQISCINMWIIKESCKDFNYFMQYNCKMNFFLGKYLRLILLLHAWGNIFLDVFNSSQKYSWKAWTISLHKLGC